MSGVEQCGEWALEKVMERSGRSRSGNREEAGHTEIGWSTEWLFCRSHALVTTMYAKHFILTRGGQTFPHDIDLALCMCA